MGGAGGEVFACLAGEMEAVGALILEADQAPCNGNRARSPEVESPWRRIECIGEGVMS